jgi:[ribosomal protein S18]-alanine N-acetyltransferase
MLVLESWAGGEAAVLALEADGRTIDPFARKALREPNFALVHEAAKGWARIWIARPHAGAPAIGFLVSWLVADELHILSVAVEVSAQRRGIGRALMNAALDFGRSERVRLVLLEVRRSNRAAIKLYRSLSFSAMGVRPQYYADTGEDAVEMALTLDPSTGSAVSTRDEVRLDD